MTASILIMYIVAVIFAVIGLGLLVMLTRHVSEQKVYAYRMIGIMALSLGIVLIMSATAMWRWSVAA